MSAPPPSPGTPSPGTPRASSSRGMYRRRVTSEHVGERVSLRFLTDDPEQGPVPTDVVGRLLAVDEDTMVVIDRRHRLHVVDPSRLLASRVVPPHPKLPAEPDVGSREQPLVRQAARVLLLDPDDRVLLAGFSPQPDQRIWTAPGGGLDPDEDHHTAATRELAEELALDVEIGPWIWSRRATFPFRGVWIDQQERWFLARTDTFEPEGAPLDDVGMDLVRWWSPAQLRTTSERLAPARLADHLDALLRDGPPAEPIDVGV